MVLGISVLFLLMLVTANLKANSSILTGSFSTVSNIPPVETEINEKYYSLLHHCT